MKSSGFLSLISDGRFWRFCLVGGFCVFLNISILYVLVYCLGFNYLVAAALGFFVLNAFSYCINKSFSFGISGGFVFFEFVRYFLVMAISLGLNLILMWVLVSAGVGVLAASLILSVGLAALNFSAHNIFTFKSGGERTRAILVVSAFFPSHGGGIEVVAGNLVRGFVDRGGEVSWIAGGPASELPDWKQGNLHIFQAASLDVLERWIGLPFPVWGFKSLRQLWCLIDDVDVVNVHDYLYIPSLIAIAFALIKGKRIILTQHIGFIDFDSVIARLVLKVLNRTVGALVLSIVDQVVYVGRPVKDYFDKFVSYRAAPALIPNGVDHCLYKPAARHDSPLVRVLFVGRFVEKKGVELFRSSIDLPGISWTFIGWGPKTPLAWPEASERGVIVLERLRSADVVPYYQDADLLVLPSKGEGFPLVLQEALACGTPVLVSDEVADAFPTIDARCVRSVDVAGEGGAARLREALAKCANDRTWLSAGRSPAEQLAAQWSWDRCVDGYWVLAFPNTETVGSRLAPKE